MEIRQRIIDNSPGGFAQGESYPCNIPKCPIEIIPQNSCNDVLAGIGICEEGILVFADTKVNVKDAFGNLVHVPEAKEPRVIKGSPYSFVAVAFGRRPLHFKYPYATVDCFFNRFYERYFEAFDGDYMDYLEDCLGDCHWGFNGECLELIIASYDKYGPFFRTAMVNDEIVLGRKIRYQGLCLVGSRYFLDNYHKIPFDREWTLEENKKAIEKGVGKLIAKADADVAYNPVGMPLQFEMLRKEEVEHD